MTTRRATTFLKPARLTRPCGARVPGIFGRRRFRMPAFPPMMPRRASRQAFPVGHEATFPSAHHRSAPQDELALNC